jgi:hypothetical protein
LAWKDNLLAWKASKAAKEAVLLAWETSKLAKEPSNKPLEANLLA